MSYSALCLSGYSYRWVVQCMGMRAISSWDGFSPTLFFSKYNCTISSVKQFCFKEIKALKLAAHCTSLGSKGFNFHCFSVSLPLCSPPGYPMYEVVNSRTIRIYYSDIRSCYSDNQLCAVQSSSAFLLGEAN